MTTLDQAFIKAFSRQGVVPLPPSSRQTPPADENQMPPAEEEPARPLGMGRSEADRVLAALEQPLKQEMFNGRSRTNVELPPTSSNTRVQEREYQGSTRPQLDFDNRQSVASAGPWSIDSGTWNSGPWNSTVESCCIDAPVTTPTIEPETVPESVYAEESEPVVPPPASFEPPQAPSIAPPPTTSAESLESPPEPDTAPPPHILSGIHRNASRAVVQAGLAGGSLHVAKGLPAADRPGGRRIGPLGRRLDGGPLLGP